jgi:peptidoglycan/LPS O-acetylase OafA/YrhL
MLSTKPNHSGARLPSDEKRFIGSHRVARIYPLHILCLLYMAAALARSDGSPISLIRFT